MQNENIDIKLNNISATLYKLEIIAEEIINFTKADESEVWKRICLEMEQPGHNVSRRAKEYGVSPHEFDDNMLRLYRESDGFIYETLIESRNPFRANKWRNIVKFLLSVSGEEIYNKRILMYGDSVGSDSIFLKQLGFDIYYYDFDSYCSDFANYRFNKRNLNINKFAPNSEVFDFIICLEVAEHVTEPRDLVKELNLLISEDGYCIFSEGFQLITEYLPTHLRSNLKYVGKTDELFKEVGMHVLWRDPDDKPIVYTKRQQNFQNIASLQSRLYKKLLGKLKGLTKKLIKP